MRTVTLIKGDGIGPEISQSVIDIFKALNAPIEWDIQEAGADVLEKEGTVLPQKVLDSIKKNKVALKAPVTTPIGHGFKSVNVTLRKALDLYISLRPAYNIAGIKTRFDKVDLITVRENTEDLYAGIERKVDDDTMESIKLITRSASTRIAEFAFEYAKKNNRKMVSAVTKANICKLTDGLFLECARKVSEKYPEIKCIGTAGPFVGNDFHKNAWDFYRNQAKNNKDFSYAVDEHYYVAPEWLYENTSFYDDYPRDVYVFAGEYAAHDANLSNSVDGAVAEAAMMTGMERNGDVVRLASYAPLFNRIGHSQWTPDMIWFDADKVVLTPTYYVQKMFSDFAGSAALDLNGQEKTLREKKIYISAVKNAEGKKIIKIANGSDEEQSLALSTNSGSLAGSIVEIAKLTAKGGIAKKVLATDAIGTSGGTKGVSPDVMSNLQVCEKRAPEAVDYSLTKKDFTGEIILPAKSFVVISL